MIKIIFIFILIILLIFVFKKKEHFFQTTTSSTTLEGHLNRPVGAILYKNYPEQSGWEWQARITEGNWDYQAFSIIFGAKNDDTSFIRVNPGYKAILYQHGDFTGIYTDMFSEGDYNLTTSDINNEASSIKVISTKNEPIGAILYQYDNNMGWAARFPKGLYDYLDYVKQGAIIDDASSIVVNDGYKATLYTGWNLDGDAVEFTKSSNSFGSYNNKFKSIKVEESSSSTSNETITNETITQYLGRQVGAILYKNYPSHLNRPVGAILYKNYPEQYGWDWQARITEGNWDYQALSSIFGAKNDDTSFIRIRVNPGYKAILYQHGDFTGIYTDMFSEGDYNLTTSDINNEASSIKVISTKNEPIGAILYQYDNNMGWAARFPKGLYDYLDYVKQGAIIDDASSIVVNDGYKATLYTGLNLDGDAVEFTNSSNSFGSYNDIFKSIKVEVLSSSNPTTSIKVEESSSSNPTTSIKVEVLSSSNPTTSITANRDLTNNAIQTTQSLIDCKFNAKGETLFQCKDICNNQQNCSSIDCNLICESCTNNNCIWNITPNIDIELLSPESIVVKGFSGNKIIKLTWIKPSSPSEIIRYYIVITTPIEPDFLQIYSLYTNRDLCEYIIPNLENEKPYDVYLFAKNNIGISKKSNKITIVPDLNSKFNIEEENSYSNSIENYYRQQKGPSFDMKKEISNFERNYVIQDLKNIIINDLKINILPSTYNVNII